MKNDNQHYATIPNDQSTTTKKKPSLLNSFANFFFKSAKTTPLINANTRVNANTRDYGATNESTSQHPPQQPIHTPSPDQHQAPTAHG